MFLGLDDAFAAAATAMGSRLEQKSSLVRKRIEQHTFDDEQGEEYEGSKFGGFPEYFRRKKIKLQNLDTERRANSDKPQILRGIVCHVNGYTQPSLNDLHVMIVEHGGGFVQYLDGKTMVTHIIASNLTPKKKEEFRRYRVVKPSWIVDSIKEGRVLPWDAYRVIDEGFGQKVLAFDDGKVVSQVSKSRSGYREQTESSWYTEKLKGSQTQKLSNLNDSFGDSSLMDEDLDRLLEEEAGVVSEPAGIDNTAERSLSEPAGADQTAQLGLTKFAVADNTLADVSTETVHFEDVEQPAHPDDHSALRPRQGSQEPDYTMAVIAQSEVMRSIPPEKLAQMSAEEHNALLLSDPKIRKSTVVHPDFLEQYYRESRLHHLSTWKADLKSQLQAMTSDAKKVGKRTTGMRRYILHVDFDCFFAAVSLNKAPEYKDKPAVVAHGGGSGSEIASCNYPAREYGVKNGMWMRRAQELCPDLKILPYDFPAYEQASRHFYEAIIATGGVVQSVSIDEALVDISDICFAHAGTDGVKRNEGGVYREQQRAEEIAQHLRDGVLRMTNCAVSVGVGGNILLAKIALRKAKPAGQYHLKPEDVLDVVGQLEVQALPGVAWSIGGKLEDIGIKLVKDVRECSRDRLTSTLGPKTGEKIWDYARGIDKTEVGDQVVRKSVSAEVNWGVRFENQEQVDEFVAGLCGELHKRLLREGVKGKQLTMKVMRRAADAPLDPPKHLGHGKCDTYNKSIQLGVATNEVAILTKESVNMIRSFGISPGELRGIGVQMQKLEPLRLADSGRLASSQKRLQFIDKPRVVSNSTTAVQSAVQLAVQPAVQSAVQPAVQPGVKSVLQPSEEKLLNTLGTQFVLPTQFDPATLDELPSDIRSKLAKQQPDVHEADQPGSAAAWPNASQLDAETLEALPQDIQDEIKAMYASPRKPKQVLLPQSPRKMRPEPKSKPTKRKKPTTSVSRTLRSTSSMTQTNFLAKQAVTSQDAVEEIDEAFLTELPEDIRKEVLAQQRLLRLQRTGGIDVSMHQKPRALQKRAAKAHVEKVLWLRPASPVPTFTSQKLSTLADLRDAIRAWVEEFAAEGPFDEDLKVLTDYLKQVVSAERDLAKAIAVERWLKWVVGQQEVLPQWRKAVNAVKQSIQHAADERGLGDLQF